MTFTPDVPSSALTANEYNAGYNVETDTRSVKSVAGDQYILSNIPGTAIFVTSGFRNNDVYWFVVATLQGDWYAMDQTGSVTDITPQPITGTITGNTTFTSITGNSVSSTAGTYSGVIQSASSGGGSQATFTVTIASPGVNYNSTGVMSSATTFTGITGNAGSAPPQTYSNVAVSATTGSGTGARFRISLAGNINTYSNVVTISNTIGGNGYAFSDQITIWGNTIGGAFGTNDLSFNVASVTSNAVTITNTVGGRNYAVPNTITLPGTSLGGTSLNNLTFTLGGSVANITIGNFSGYSNNTAITDSWNGSTLFLNDQINPPMYLTGASTQLGVYDYPDPETGDTYVWNYDVTTNTSGGIIPLYANLTAGFTRVYNSPNLGSLLVSGNLVGVIAGNVTYPTPGSIQNLPTSVRWSQNFGINSGPLTWTPTLTNIANQVEVPVRGPVVDGFPLNGNFYICSYWDTIVLSPIAYTSTTAPVFGVKLVNQGRGMLNENCWVNVDNSVYGLDARDVWKFDGGNFTPIGDQRVKNYLLANINPLYSSQVFMQHNSAKYSIEIYYPDLTSTGYCNQVLSYRYDLDIWNPPRQVNKATQATEAPTFVSNVANLATRCIVYSSAQGNIALVEKDTGTSFLNNTPISSLFQRNNISFGQPYSASVQVHRVLPEVYGTGNIGVTIGGADSVASTPTYKPTVSMPIVTDNPWVQINQNEARVITMQVTGNSTANTWQMSAANWQVTVVQETR